MRATTINDFVLKVKSDGMIDDHTDEFVSFGKIMGFCMLKGGDIGVLLNACDYQIVLAYIGEDNLVHMSEWPVVGCFVSKEKMDTEKGIITFNSTVTKSSRVIIKVAMLNGEVIVPERR